MTSSPESRDGEALSEREAIANQLRDLSEAIVCGWLDGQNFDRAGVSLLLETSAEIIECRSTPADTARAGVDPLAKLVMPNGDVLNRRRGKWDLTTASGAVATNEEDWELVERYGLDALVAAAFAALSAAPTPGGGGGDHTAAQSQPCADAGAHIPRSPEAQHTNGKDAR